VAFHRTHDKRIVGPPNGLRNIVITLIDLAPEGVSCRFPLYTSCILNVPKPPPMLVFQFVGLSDSG
jgi:hypothetical protein